MQPRIYWVQAPNAGRLAVVSRPAPRLGLQQQMSALRDAGIDTLVSLLTEGEAASVGLADEAVAAATAGVSFHRLPIADFTTPPSFASAAGVIESVAGDLVAGRGVGAHCYAGRGRSPMFVAAVLVHRGLDADVAIDLVSTARGVRIPETPAQRRWITDFANWCRVEEQR